MIEGKDLDNRVGTGQEKRRGDLEKRVGLEPTAADQLALLKQRIAAAETLQLPDGNGLHCGHCWGEGKAAVLKVLGGEP
jgi:hypothetical protein